MTELPALNHSQSWVEFWNLFPLKFGEDEYFRQVGKTHRGQPLSDNALGAIAANICKNLAITPADRVLDLCCGNGLLTRIVSKSCAAVIGVDYSAPLIETAQRNFTNRNIAYRHLSALNVSLAALDCADPFAKIYMYEALQHFLPGDLTRLLERLRAVSTAQPRWLIASILDEERIWEFYNTPELKRRYRAGLANGELMLGTWWRKEFIEQTCHDAGLNVRFIDQPSSFHTSHYRFDVVITA